MKLYATVISERGKPVTKGGQEWVKIALESNGRTLGDLQLIQYKNGTIRAVLFLEGEGEVFWAEMVPDLDPTEPGNWEIGED